MAKYISNRQQNLKIGIVSYTEDKTVLEVTGKVGIGTTNAQYSLDVHGNVRITGGLFDSNNNVGTAGSVLSSTGSGLSWIAAASGGGISSVSISTNTSNQLQYLTYVTGTGSTTGFGITTTGLVFNPSTGNLGIGTTNPTSKLHVVGNVYVSGIATLTQISAGGTVGTAGSILSSTGSGLSWIPAAPAGDITGITVRDSNNTIVGTSGSVTQLTFSTGFGVTGTTGVAGIATITLSSNIVGTSLSISGISTFSGITTHTAPLFGTVASFSGVVTALSFSGNASSATFATNAGIATNLEGGVIGNIPYQSATDTTAFLTNGGSGTILQSNGVGNAPTWVAAAPAGAVSGLVIRDSNNTIVGTSGSVTQLTFSTGLSVTGTTGVAGIATITLSSNIVGTSLSISGITTLGVTSTTNLTSQSLVVSGISTFTNGPILVGTATSTGTASQPLQVDGGAYVSGNLGIGTTNPTSKLHVIGDVRVSGVVTATTFVGALTGTATSTTNIPNLTGAITSVGTATTLGSFSSANLATALTDETGSGVAVFATSPTLVTPVLGDATATSIVVGSGVTINASGINAAAGIITASQLSTGASGTGININIDTISGPATLTIDPAAVGDNTGAVRIKGDLYVDGIQFIVNSTTIELADFNVGIATTVGTNALLDGAGIGIGSTGIRKTLTWSNSSTALKSSEDFDVASGKVYRVNGTSVLSNNTLGSGIVNSSLTSVGTLGSLSVGNVYSTGISTLGVTSTTNLTSQTLNVSGIATLTQISAGGTVGTAGSILSSTGSGLSWIPAASGGSVLSISTSTSSDPQFITFVSSASTTSIGITASNLTFIPSSGSLGIGTTNPTSKLHVVGDVLVSGISTLGTVKISSGIITATTGIITYFGDGSNLTGLSAGGVSISTSAATQSQFLTFVAGTGTTTGFGVSTTGLVFNPSTGNLGIGTTNPLQKAHILGGLLVAAGSSTTQHITQNAYELNSGTLSWEGSAGQLFSITNNLTSGSIFSVNDVSGIPSIDVNANGTVSMVSYGGSVGIGTTLATQKLHVQGNVRIAGALYDVNNNVGTAGSVLSSTGSGVSWIAAGSGGGGISSVSISTNTTNQNQFLTFVAGTGTTTGFGVSTTGLVFNPSTGTLSATIFTSLSDETQKTNIRPVENAAYIVSQMNGVYYDWIDGHNTGSVGVIAQEMEQVLPEVVSTNDQGLKSVSYGNIVGVLIEAIKEQQVRIGELERKSNA